MDKPCPFCSSRNTEVEELGSDERPFFTVTCRTCEAEGPVAVSAERALEAWNVRRRPKPDGDGA